MSGDDLSGELGRLLAGIVESEVGGSPDVGLLLSGGVDSLSVGFAAESVGKRVSAYTFKVEGIPSRDAFSAERAARAFGWKFRLVEVPVGAVRQDFLRLIGMGCRKKTEVECLWPFLYLVPEIAESHVLSGMWADGHFGLSKRAMIHHRATVEEFDRFRVSYFASVPQRALFRGLCSHNNKVWVAPYDRDPIRDLFLGSSWDALNKPIQKAPIVRAYRDRFRLVGRRRHENLQLVAGIPSVFRRLLEDTTLNKRGRTRMMDLVRDVSSEATL